MLCVSGVVTWKRVVASWTDDNPLTERNIAKNLTMTFCFNFKRWKETKEITKSRVNYHVIQLRFQKVTWHHKQNLRFQVQTQKNLQSSQSRTSTAYKAHRCSAFEFCNCCKLHRFPPGLSLIQLHWIFQCYNESNFFFANEYFERRIDKKNIIISTVNVVSISKLTL